MKILITNINMCGYNGTTMYAKELAESLIKKGNEVAIYTKKIGEIGVELIKKGIEVTTRLKTITFKPDIIHAHHNVTTFDVLFFYKKVPVIFWIHDRITQYDYPPFHKNIIKYMSVDYNCKDRYKEDSGFLTTDSEVLYNWVNLERFKLKKRINKTPKKALVFSNYASTDSYLDNIRKACNACNIELSIIGAKSGNIILKPENHLSEYDLIFAKAKAAMESIATGSGVIVFDFVGLAGMVTSENYASYRRLNFGRKLMVNNASEENFINEIKKYNADDISIVSKKIRKEVDINIAINQLLDIYRKSIIDHKKGHVGKYSFRLTNFLHIKLITFYFRMLQITPRYLKDIILFLISSINKSFNKKKNFVK